MELSQVHNGQARAPLPLEDDIMQCARFGETGLIKKLLDAGKFDAKYRDEEGITPLHVSRAPDCGDWSLGTGTIC